MTKKQKWEETQRLTQLAVVSVNELSKHLEKEPHSDKERMYKANKALHMLWEI